MAGIDTVDDARLDPDPEEDAAREPEGAWEEDMAIEMGVRVIGW